MMRHLRSEAILGSASNGGAGFDEFGPKLGTAYLLGRTATGFAPQSRHLLERVVGQVFEGFTDYDRLGAGLAAVARVMDKGDLALAAIMTGRLPIPMLTPAHVARAIDAGFLHADFPHADVLRKAGPDDPRHPGWPAGAAEGRGGQFRPKGVADAAETVSREERAKRLASRRSLRATLRRVLTLKRLARLLCEAGAELVPGAEIPATASMIDDFVEMSEEIVAGNKDIKAATEFVRQGPRLLDDLTVAARDETFSSFDAFKKLDLEKRFGPAGEGYEYHHIVEQGPHAVLLPAEQLQSTSNIVRIPRLLHEEISSIYATSKGIGGISIRQAVRGEAFDVQREAGLRILRQVGVLVP